MGNLRADLEGLGLEVKFSEETAAEKWRTLAREYRLVGSRAERFETTRDEFIAAIMCGDLDITDATGGVALTQALTHAPPGAPKTITYNPPTARSLAAGGIDAATMVTKWMRIAASLTGHTEGELTLWLTGHDQSLAQTIVQFFTNA